MQFNSTGLIIIGAVLILAVLLWRATGKSTSIKNSKGNIMTGNVRCNATQVYKGDTTISSSEGSKIGAKEIITWLIAIAGVVIAGLGLYHAWFSSRP